MYDFVAVWLCWLLFCFPAFFMKNSNNRLIYMFGSLIVIILYPYYFKSNGLFLSVGHIFILFWSSLAMIRLHFKWRNYIYILFIAYVYTIYFLWRVTSPIVDLPSFLLMGLLASIIINQFIKTPSFSYRIYMWLAGISFGHLLYSFISQSYHLHEIKNFTYYFILLLSVLLFLSIQNSWKFVQLKIDEWLQIIENKKRWHS